MPISERTQAIETADADITGHLVMRRPDDWHVHLRDGEMLAAVVNETALQFARAIVMPNLDLRVTTIAATEAYRSRIIAALASGLPFTPQMTVYLTDNIDPSEIERGFRSVLEHTPCWALSTFSAASAHIVPFLSGATLAWTYKGLVNDTKRARND
jgi:dihydroorotase